MLLSEILQIAKNIKKYHKLNEALKSSILTLVFHKFDNSNLTLQPKQISPEGIEYDTDRGRSFYDIEWVYQKAAYDKTLTLDKCDSIKGREQMIDTVYKKRNNKKNYYNKGNIFKQIIDVIKDTTGYDIGLSEITDNDLIKINMEDAKKKIYKSGLLFWMDYNDNLKAITKDNKIILLIVKDYNSWYTVNPNYNEKTDFSKFEFNRDSIDEYIEKAFIEIPCYSIYTKNTDIKNVIKTNNIKGLQSLPGIDYVYVVKETGMQKSDYSQKKLDRKQYKEFLKQQLNIADDNIKRYINIIKVNRSLNIDSKIISKLNQLQELCMDAIVDLQDIEINSLNTMLDSLFFDSSFLYNSVELTHYPEIRYKAEELLGSESINSYNMNYGRHNRYTKKSFHVHSTGDIFFLYNLIINAFIEIINNTINYYEDYVKEKNKQDNIDNITYYLDILKRSYNELLGEINEYKKLIEDIDMFMTTIDSSLTSKINNIFDKFFNFNFDKVNI